MQVMTNYATEKRVRVFLADEDHHLFSTLNNPTKSFPKLVVYKNNMDTADFVARFVSAQMAEIIPCVCLAKQGTTSIC
jgi:hypothetical protein